MSVFHCTFLVSRTADDERCRLSCSSAVATTNPCQRHDAVRIIGTWPAFFVVNITAELHGILCREFDNSSLLGTAHRNHRTVPFQCNTVWLKCLWYAEMRLHLGMGDLLGRRCGIIEVIFKVFPAIAHLCFVQ